MSRRSHWSWARKVVAACSAQSSPSKELSVLDEVVKWVPWGSWVGPVSQLVRWGITWLTESDRSAKTEPRDVSPAGVVAGAFAQTVLASGGPQPQIVVTDREPVGDQRKDADAIVRVAVPAWGVVRVQDGKPPLVAAFAEVDAGAAVPLALVRALEDLNALIAEHNRFYPIERALPLDPSTGGYAELGSTWLPRPQVTVESLCLRAKLLATR